MSEIKKMNQPLLADDDEIEEDGEFGPQKPQQEEIRKKRNNGNNRRVSIEGFKVNEDSNSSNNNAVIINNKDDNDNDKSNSNRISPSQPMEISIPPANKYAASASKSPNIDNLHHTLLQAGAKEDFIPIDNHDVFFSQVYNYFEKRGFWCSVLSSVFEKLLVLARAHTHAQHH